MNIEVITAVKVKAISQQKMQMWARNSASIDFPESSAESSPKKVKRQCPSPMADAGIRSQPTTSVNPQSNGVIEAAHKSVAVILRMQAQAHPPADLQEAHQLVGRALAAAMHATRCASHSSINNCSPGGLVFRRDMHLDIPFVADTITLRDM